MIDHDSPSVTVVSQQHVLGAVPVRGDCASIDNAVVIPGLSIVYALYRWRDGDVRHLPTGWPVGGIAERRAKTKHSGRCFAVSFFFYRTRQSARGAQTQSPRHPSFANYYVDWTARRFPVSMRVCTFITLQLALNGI